MDESLIAYDEVDDALKFDSEADGLGISLLSKDYGMGWVIQAQT